MAADEPEGDARCRIAPAAAPAEPVVAQGIGAGSAKGEGMVKPQAPAHANAEHPVDAAGLDLAEALDGVGRQEALAVGAQAPVRERDV
jgi:hypothetical protein